MKQDIATKWSILQRRADLRVHLAYSDTKEPICGLLGIRSLVFGTIQSPDALKPVFFTNGCRNCLRIASHRSVPLETAPQ